MRSIIQILILSTTCLILGCTSNSLPPVTPSNAAVSPEDQPPITTTELRQADTTIPVITYRGTTSE